MSKEAISMERALKLALEALEVINSSDDDRAFLNSDECEAIWVATDALREALAQERSSDEQPAPAAELRKPQQGCTRSHPHENMDAMCELRTEIARLANENARLKTQQQQEPVAEVKLKQQGGNAGLATVIHEIFDPVREPLRVGDKLYTSPPANANAGKPWVGLTDEDIKEAEWLLSAIKQYEAYTLDELLTVEGVDAFARAIEAKLREKNA